MTRHFPVAHVLGVLPRARTCDDRRNRHRSRLPSSPPRMQSGRWCTSIPSSRPRSTGSHRARFYEFSTICRRGRTGTDRKDPATSGLSDSHLPAETGKSWEELGHFGNPRKRCADFMTNTAHEPGPAASTSNSGTATAVRTAPTPEHYRRVGWDHGPYRDADQLWRNATSRAPAVTRRDAVQVETISTWTGDPAAQIDAVYDSAFHRLRV